MSSRPQRVRLFEALMYASAAIAVGRYFFFRPLVLPWLFFTLLWWGLVVWLTWLAARRRKEWARHPIYFLFVADLVKSMVFRNFLPPVWSLAFAAMVTLEALACYFVFTGESRAWFKADYN